MTSVSISVPFPQTEQDHANRQHVEQTQSTIPEYSLTQGEFQTSRIDFLTITSMLIFDYFHKQGKYAAVDCLLQLDLCQNSQTHRPYAQFKQQKHRLY